MRFVLASNNKGKLRELREILEDMNIEVLSQSEAGLSLEAEETGTTFEENALIKAKAACEALGETAIADDSGLVVDALDGQPGVFSARYGGDKCHSDEQRTELLLHNMDGIENRTARFVSCIACVFPDGRQITAHGYCEGVITNQTRGEGGFGYDPIFELPNGKTMSEITDKEKNGISHRGVALRKFKKKLEEMI